MDILLIEDSLADAYLTRHALESALPEGRIKLVQDGEQALTYLCREDPAAIPPDLILLDLNLPKIDGLTLLAWLKATPRLRDTPVIILTTSSLESDVSRAYALGAYSYLSKPMELDAYLALGDTIAGLWRQWIAQSGAPQGNMCRREASPVEAKLLRGQPLQPGASRHPQA